MRTGPFRLCSCGVDANGKVVAVSPWVESATAADPLADAVRAGAKVARAGAAVPTCLVHARRVTPRAPRAGSKSIVLMQTEAVHVISRLRSCRRIDSWMAHSRAKPREPSRWTSLNTWKQPGNSRPSVRIACHMCNT